MDRSSTLTVQTNQDHKTEKSNAVSPTTQRCPVCSKELIELQAEIEGFQIPIETLKNRLRAIRAENLSPREQLQLLNDLAEYGENITVIQNQIMDLRRGLDDFNRV